MRVKSALVLALCQAAAAVRLAVRPSDYALAMEVKGKARAGDNECRRMSTPMMCQPKPGQGARTAAAVVSTYQEDIHWLNEMPWSDHLTVLVHNRSSQRSHDSKTKVPDSLILAEESEDRIKALNSRRSSPINFVDVPNQGDEAAAYLTWITEHYDGLPDVAFFLQGHRCAHHAPFDMSIALPNIRQCFSPQQGYLDLNTYREGSEAQCKGTRELMDRPMMGYQIEKFGDIWARLFAKELGELPTRICWDSYGQFAVSRDVIRRHPLDFYKTLREGVINGTTTMEFFWRAVFVPGAIINEPPAKKDKFGKALKKHQFSEEEIAENSRVVDLAGQKPGGRFALK